MIGEEKQGLFVGTKEPSGKETTRVGERKRKQNIIVSICVYDNVRIISL